LGRRRAAPQVGRLRIAIDGAPLKGGFRQRLDLAAGAIGIEYGTPPIK
jgi:hypothetical protein